MFRKIKRMSNFLITNLLVFIPLVGSLSIGIFKNKLSEKFVTFLAIFSVFISTVLSVWMVIQTFFFDYYLNANLLSGPVLMITSFILDF